MTEVFYFNLDFNLHYTYMINVYFAKFFNFYLLCICLRLSVH